MIANEIERTTRSVSLMEKMAAKYEINPTMFEQTLRKTVMPSATTNEELAAFLMICNKYNLNPITREIYAFPKKGGGIQPIVSIDGWMNLAGGHPEFDGVEFEYEKDEKGAIAACTCIMYRKGRSRPVRVTEYVNECRRNTDPWNGMPSRMIRHKAYIQAARMCFGYSGIMEQDEFDGSELKVVEGAEVPPVNGKPQSRMETLKEKLKASVPKADIISEHKAQRTVDVPVKNVTEMTDGVRVEYDTGETLEEKTQEQKDFEALPDIPDVLPKTSSRRGRPRTETPVKAQQDLPPASNQKTETQPPAPAQEIKEEHETIGCFVSNVHPMGDSRWKVFTNDNDVFYTSIPEIARTLLEAREKGLEALITYVMRENKCIMLKAALGEKKQ